MKKDSLRERAQLTKLLKRPPRSSHQLNQLFTSDVEILKTATGYLTISTDALGEEIALRLYRSPFLIGWMAVMNSVSDLVASGTQPLGLVMSTEWARSSKASERAQIQKGINAALRKAQVPLLGGDQGISHQHHVLTSTILGQSKYRPLDRMGIRPGDFLFLAQPRKLGLGPVLALKYLDQSKGGLEAERLFRPQPSFRLMEEAWPQVVASIDTSDGLFTSFAILCELNAVGIEFKASAELYHPVAKKYVHRTKRSETVLAVMELGDLQTLIACRPHKAQYFIDRPHQWTPVGQVTSEKSRIRCHSDRGKRLNFLARQFTGAARGADEIRSFTEDINRLLRG